MPNFFLDKFYAESRSSKKSKSNSSNLVHFLSQKEENGLSARSIKNLNSSYDIPKMGTNNARVPFSNSATASITLRGPEGKAYDVISSKVPITGITIDYSYDDSNQARSVAKALSNNILKSPSTAENTDKITIFPDEGRKRILYENQGINSQVSGFLNTKPKGTGGIISQKLNRFPSQEIAHQAIFDVYSETIPKRCIKDGVVMQTSPVANTVRAYSMANEAISEADRIANQYNLPHLSKAGSIAFEDLQRPAKRTTVQKPLTINDVLAVFEEQEKEEVKPSTSAASNLNLNTASVGEIIEDIKKQEEAQKAKATKTEDAPISMDLETMIHDIEEQHKEEKVRVATIDSNSSAKRYKPEGRFI